MKHVTVHNSAHLLSKSFSIPMREVFEAEPGDLIKLKDYQGQDLFDVELVDLWHGPLAHAPAVLLEMSHDPLSRTFTGLQTHLALYRDDPEEATPMDMEITILVVTPRQSAILRPTAHELKKVRGS